MKNGQSSMFWIKNWPPIWCLSFSDENWLKQSDLYIHHLFAGENMWKRGFHFDENRTKDYGFTKKTYFYFDIVCFRMQTSAYERQKTGNSTTIFLSQVVNIRWNVSTTGGQQRRNGRRKAPVKNTSSFKTKIT